MTQTTVPMTAVPAGSQITYTFDAGRGPVTITGTVAQPVGMSRLGNQGFAIVQADGTVEYISRYAKVTVL